MASMRIARTIFFKYCTISIVLILVIYITTFLLFAEPKVTEVTLHNVITTLVKDIIDNIWFIIMVCGLMLVGMYFLGGLVGDCIQVKRMSFYFIGGVSIFLTWVLLFVTCAVTGGVIRSINFGLDGFVSALKNWTIYGLIPFLFFGLVHGLLMGYFLGKEIAKKGFY